MTEYAELISSTHKSFSISDDIGAIARIGTSILQTRNARHKKLLAESGDLQTLEKRLSQTKRELTQIEDEYRREIGDHSQRMNSLDREKFSLAKRINDLETGTASSESQLLKLNAEIESLPETVVDRKSGGQKVFSGQEGRVLKLAVYRDLGINLVSSCDAEERNFEKAIIRSRDGRDLKTVDIGKVSVDEVWSSCS